MTSVAQSTDCGLRAGQVTISTQSDINTIDSCTTIYGTLNILLLAAVAGVSDASPTVFTLPSGLQSVQGQVNVVCPSPDSPTTTLIAPGLKTIGNSTSTGDLIFPFLIDSGTPTNISFPALTTIAGGFHYETVNSAITDFTGFPLLAQIGVEVFINGSFKSLELPSLTFVDGQILIASSSPSFKCPSNITPKIVPECEDVTCGYGDLLNGISPPQSDNCPNGGATASGTTGDSPSSTATAGATTTSGIKTSDALILYPGNSSTIKVNLTGISFYIMMALGSIFSFGIIGV